MEKHDVLNSRNLRETVPFPKDATVKNIHVLEYKVTIEGNEIQIFIEKYLDTGEIFLKNGWVVTK